ADWRKSRKGSRPDSRLTAWSPALDTTVSEIAMSATPSVPGSSPLTTPAETVPLAGQHIVVVGGGMTAHRFSSRLRAQHPDGGWSLPVIGDQPQQPYDLVHLPNRF